MSAFKNDPCTCGRGLCLLLIYVHILMCWSLLGRKVIQMIFGRHLLGVSGEEKGLHVASPPPSLHTVETTCTHLSLLLYLFFLSDSGTSLFFFFFLCFWKGRGLSFFLCVCSCFCYRYYYYYYDSCWYVVLCGTTFLLGSLDCRIDVKNLVLLYIYYQELLRSMSLSSV